MKILRTVPLFAFLLVLYNIVVFTGSEPMRLGQVAFEFHLPSDALLSMTWNDILLAIGVILLYVEVLKATRTGTVSIVDHGVSMVVFVVFLIEFIVVDKCGTSTFLILVLMSLLDVLAGFTISIVAARRDLAIASPGNGV